MKYYFIVPILLVLSNPAFAEIGNLEQRVSELEANSALDIFKFSGLLTDRLDVVNANQSSGSVNTSFNRTKFALGISAEPSANLKAYARLVMSKYMNDTFHQGQDPAAFSSSIRDLNVSDSYSGPGVWVETAYFDYDFKGAPLTLSAGRLPTVYGAPTHFWNNRARMGTYPTLAYNVSLDGFGLTYKFDSLVGHGNSLVARVIYSPFSQHNFTQETSAPTQNGGAIQEQSTPMLVTGMLDYSVTDSPGFESLNAIVQYSTISNFLIGDGVIVINNSQSATYSSNIKLALQFLTFHLEVDNLIHSNFDFSATHLMSTTASTGIANVQSSSIPTVPVGNIGGYGVNPNPANLLGTAGTSYGNIDLFDVRYHLAWTSAKRPYIGAEYQMGSRDALYFSGVTEDVTGFYANRGYGYHFYWLQPINENFSLRLGSIFQTQLQMPANFGATQDNKINFTSYYLNLRVDI